MKRESLFRQVTQRSVEDEWLGAAVQLRQPPTRLVAAIAVVFALSLAAFAALASYSRREVVAGQIVPEHGFARLRVTRPSVVLERYVSEGQAVQRGAPLLLVSTDSRSTAAGETQAAISEDLVSRRRSLDEQVSACASSTTGTHRSCSARSRG